MKRLDSMPRTRSASNLNVAKPVSRSSSHDAVDNGQQAVHPSPAAQQVQHNPQLYPHGGQANPPPLASHGSRGYAEGPAQTSPSQLNPGQQSSRARHVRQGSLEDAASESSMDSFYGQRQVGAFFPLPLHTQVSLSTSAGMQVYLMLQLPEAHVAQRQSKYVVQAVVYTTQGCRGRVNLEQQTMLRPQTHMMMECVCTVTV